MTILEELIDLALNVCEKSRTTTQLNHNHSRSAVILSSIGKAYTGCDIHMNSDITTINTTTLSGSSGNSNNNNSSNTSSSSSTTSLSLAHGVSAERAAFLIAIADGITKIDCIVICSDTMISFPSPDGLSREFMRSFGIYPVILVNCNLEIKYTSSDELYPLDNIEKRNEKINKNISTINTDNNNTSSSSSASSSNIYNENDNANNGNDGNNINDNNQNNKLFLNDDDKDIYQWNNDRVLKWLIYVNLNELYSIFQNFKIDGPLLLHIDEIYCKNILEIKHSLLCRKLIRSIQELKKYQVLAIKEKSLDEMDEYIMLLETHRLKLIAKLKTIYDRYDHNQLGYLSGNQIEQMLIYMNRPIASNQVKQWLETLKLTNEKVEFPDFVAQYSSLFANEDPDILNNEKQYNEKLITDDEKGKKRDDIKKDDKDNEKWLDDDDNNHNHKSREDAKENNDDNINNNNNKIKKEYDDKNITDLKTLAELKTIFDRFAVDNVMTAPETCQALTESGIIVPRKDIAQYLRSRKHLGINRSIDFFEFVRAFAVIRGPIQQNNIKKSNRKHNNSNNNDDHDDNDKDDDDDDHDYEEGMKVEARYQGHGAWYPAKIRRIYSDHTYDVVYQDGEGATGIKRSALRHLRKGIIIN